jgi:hypothetical protein
MLGHVEPFPGVDPLIAEAKQRARRRRLLALAAAGLVVACAVGVDLAASGGTAGTPGTIPWLPTRPSLGPAHPPLAPACTASQLHASLFMQGASMSLVGPISIVNRSSQPCSLLGRPKLSFAGATSKWRETPWTNGSFSIPFDPLAPPVGSLRALRPGEHVSVQLWWSNWCGRGAKPGGSATLPPTAMVLTAPGGGRILLHNALRRSFFSPVCNGGAGSSSVLQAGKFTPFVPQGPPSSHIPLKASIVSGQPVTIKGEKLRPPTFVAKPGSWLSFTVVLTNASAEPFRFGRTCPAYTEDWGGVARAQAYVLNCRPVGAIAPGRSVKFAMRIRVPNTKLPVPAFGWTLAPHSYDAPSAMAVVQLR